MLCMAGWLADYANPTKREFTSPIATILIETIKRWRENKRTKGKHSFHLTKCSKDLQNAKIVRGLKSTINKVKKGHSQVT